MYNDSLFLRGLIGKPVHLLVVDEDDLPSMILREISSLGVVAQDANTSRFFPWAEIIEITSAEERPAHPEAGDAESAEAAIAADSEP